MCFLALGGCVYVCGCVERYVLTFIHDEGLNKWNDNAGVCMNVKKQRYKNSARKIIRVKKLFNLKKSELKTFLCFFPRSFMQEKIILIWNGESTWEKVLSWTTLKLKVFIWLFHELHGKIVFEEIFVLFFTIFLLYIREWNLFTFFFFHYLYLIQKL